MPLFSPAVAHEFARHRLGLFGIGLDTYWPQFKGLKNRLVGYQKQIATRIRAGGVQWFDAELVDSPAKARVAVPPKGSGFDFPLRLHLRVVLQALLGLEVKKVC